MLIYFTILLLSVQIGSQNIPKLYRQILEQTIIEGRTFDPKGIISQLLGIKLNNIGLGDQPKQQ